MRNLLIVILFFINFENLIAQPPVVNRGTSSTVPFDQNLFIGKSFKLPTYTDTAAANTSISANVILDSCGAKILTYEGGLNKEWVRKCSPKRWVQNSTSEDLPDLSNYIQKQTQAPTVSITPTGLVQQILPSGADLTASFLCTVGRLAATSTANATAAISSFTLNGTPITVINPSAGASGTASVDATYPRNTTTVFTLTATTSDGKTATTTSTYNFSNPKFWFTSTTTSPSNSEIIGASSDLVFPESKARNNTTIAVSGGNKYLNYAYPSALGPLTSINIGGFESIGSFTQSTVSVTTSTSAVVSYYIYTSNNALPTTTINSIQ